MEFPGGRIPNWLFRKLPKIRWLLWDKPCARWALCTCLAGWNLTEIAFGGLMFGSSEEVRAVLEDTFQRIAKEFGGEADLLPPLEEGEFRNPLPPIPRALRMFL